MKSYKNNRAFESTKLETLWKHRAGADIQGTLLPSPDDKKRLQLCLNSVLSFLADEAKVKHMPCIVLTRLKEWSQFFRKYKHFPGTTFQDNFYFASLHFVSC